MTGGRVMDRRAFLGTVAVGLLAALATVEAQPSGKVWRIGVLSLVSSPPIWSAPT